MSNARMKITHETSGKSKIFRENPRKVALKDRVENSYFPVLITFLQAFFYAFA
jgi:hypothetical protein